jgi:hypothetical protein
MRQLATVGVLASALALGSAAKADEPLPPPRVMPGAGAPPPPVVIYRLPPPPYYRISAYEVWQYYGVNRAGNWRPRVMYLPHSAFYLQTGQPYPWAVTHTTEFMPYARD